MSEARAQTLREIDRICTRFEGEWKAGSRPRIEEYWIDARTDQSGALLQELLLVDLEYRRRDGERPSVEDYQSRFPEQSDLIAETWRAHPLAQPEPTLPCVSGYEVIRKIGRGGMASVYLARDSRLGRLVALKLIACADPSAELIRRFRSEAQAAARLQHPNIVQIYEIGETKSQPYLALEYVEGQTLAEWIAGTPRPARDAARIVQTLAEAIHIAHQHGIVHRDLKPGNVLLNCDGVPKITDFGLVKFLDDDTQRTQSGVLLGTASYMAPEQAGGVSSTVGFAADIYALGAILYELVTGRPPFRAATVVETVRLARQTEPTPPRRLQPTIPRDLETICLKCLEKEPAKRYALGPALAEDLRRFLADEPVDARPVGSAERAWRWSRRNPVVAGLAAGIVASLIVGTIVSSYLALRNRALANRERIAREHAQERQHAAETVARYLFNTFRSPDPARDGRTITVAETLERAATQLKSDLPDQPMLRAELATAIAQTYLGLGLPRQAIPLLEESQKVLTSLGASDDQRALDAMTMLSSAYRAEGDFENATSLAERALDQRRARDGEDHPKTIESMNALAMARQEAGRLHEAGELHEKTHAWARTHLGDGKPETLSAKNNLAWIYQRTGRLNEAIELYEQALAGCRAALGNEHPQTLATMSNLAAAYGATGNSEGAIALLEQVLASARSKLGETHPNTLTTMGTLARVYREAGQLDKALPLAEQTLILKRAALGENHPETLNELAGLAVCLSAAGRWDKSLPLYEEVLRKRRDTLGPEHPDTLMSMGGLGAAYRRTSAPERAEAVLRECLELRRRLMPDAWETFYVQVNFGCALVDQKRFAEAEPILIAGFEGLSARAKQIAPSQRHALQAALGAIVVFYERWGKPDEAEKWRSKLSSATTPSSSTGARY